MDDILVILGLIGLTIMLNIPLGMWRATVRKFSLAWLIAVHAAVPVIVGLRLWFEISNWLIPVLIGAAVFSQWVGAKVYQNKAGLKRIGKVGEK